MGKHRNPAGIKIINFIRELGEILEYHVREEEYMFPGDLNSPIIDVTWRKSLSARFPLFIFEVESEGSKSASDNVGKVFSRYSSDFVKPLFFFHVFWERESHTVHDLRRERDKDNYGAFVLEDGLQCLDLLKGVFEQHLRLTNTLDLALVIPFIMNNDIFEGYAPQMLHTLIERDFDQAEGVNFLVALERIIAQHNICAIRKFYIEYLPRYLNYTSPPWQQYNPSLYINLYAKIVHYGLFLLTTKNPDYDNVFERLVRIEKRWQPWPLWEPFFGLSRDHDEVMLSEFPLLLTLLCAAFAPTDHAIYFSAKLRAIMKKLKIHPLHGLIWLLIASQIAKDRESYGFAREILNSGGGIPIEAVVKPPTACFIASADIHEENEILLLKSGSSQTVPSFEGWKKWIEPWTREVDLLQAVIRSFLIHDGGLLGREKFAKYCLTRSVKE